MNRFVSSALAATLALSFATATEAASVEIKNRSQWAIYHLHVGPAGDPDWGPDQLGEHVINPGETFTLNKIRCGSYDLQLIDEDGDACAIYNVKLCDDKVWDITDKHLLACQAESQ
jgi:hypothetical protein